ncbi:MAG: hypothetical protein C5B52_10775 [Bacteroidetes bacterium]|nr:MAG: hypothetical protein C5B52_10775 [Bacteroidota bacterium]
MRVTVCELSDDENDFLKDWRNLKSHLRESGTDLLLMPELPFCKWLATEKMVSDDLKMRSVQEHENWLKRLDELNATRIVYSKPVVAHNKLFNTAFVFEKGKGHSKIHAKSFFPEEEFFWEETIYHREDEPKFELLDLGEIKIGALLCTEMWFTQYARQYGKMGIDILVCPRATGIGSVERWIKCGQILSIVSGAFCLSSNKSGIGEHGFQWGGKGWIAEPITGNLLGVTDATQKFLTLEIDINKSRLAKKEYPLYVKEQGKVREHSKF